MSVFEQGYALVVGVAGLDQPATHRHAPLPLPVLNDAVDLARTLWNPEFCGYRADRVRLLLEEQATARKILAGLDWLSRRCSEEDTAIFFFSGHGLRRGNPAENFLAAYDSWTDDPPDGLISSDQLTGKLRNIQAGRLVVILDCCFAGSLGEVKGPAGGPSLPYGFRSGLDQGIYDQLGQGEGRVILASSLATETSKVAGHERNSLFTDCLIRGLRGAAGRPESATISVSDLFDFVTGEVVSLSGGQQHPIMTSRVQSNFPIALQMHRNGTTTPPETPITTAPREEARYVTDIGARDIGQINIGR